MPLTYAENTLQMEWCLNCHRQPEKFLRPKEEVFNMTYQQPGREHGVPFEGRMYFNQDELGLALAKSYNLRTVQDITSCSTCHR